MFTFKIPFIISILQQCLFSLRGIKAFIKTFSQVFCRISSVDRDHRVNIEEKTRHTCTIHIVKITNNTQKNEFERRMWNQFIFAVRSHLLVSVYYEYHTPTLHQKFGCKPWWSSNLVIGWKNLISLTNVSLYSMNRKNNWITI